MRFRQLPGTILLAIAMTIQPAGAQMSDNSATPQPSHVSRISSITVGQDANGVKVEITGDSFMSARTMKLNHPDRIVLDIMDSVLVGRSREITVNNADVKDVRAAHYKSAPPTTRIVVDLAAMHEFELLPNGKTLILKLKNSAVASHGLVQPKEPVVQQSTSAAIPQDVKKVETAVTKAPEQEAASSTEERISVVKLVAPLDATKSSAEKDDASGRSKSDRAAATFIKPATPALVSANQPPAPGSGSLTAQPVLVNAALLQQQSTAITANGTTNSSCTSGHYSGAPLNLDLKDLDIKDFFRLIHEISGLNVVLDPGVKGIVTIDVTDIPWDQALAIVLRNNGLECELEGNVLRVAALDTLRAEAEARRAQQEAQALAVPKQNYTRYLSYAHSKDVVLILKKFLSARGDVVSDDRSNAVIIEDIPATLPKIDALLTALDRKTPEVEIEARVVSATRNFARDIGTQIGFGWGNNPTAVGGGTNIPSPIAVNGPPPRFITIAPPSGTGQSIPLFSNLPATNATSGIELTTETLNYRLDFVLSMAESRGLVKVLSRPRVITQNNISALIRQGQRIPVVTASQLNGPPTVTYVDAFLRLTVTPQITNENTIFLLLDVENTTADFTHVVGQQLNPVLDTQQTTTQVLVSDGQTVVIGGVIQTTNNLAINQVPLLGSIPILGNLFKHTQINNSTAELLFFITPKIIQT